MQLKLFLTACSLSLLACTSMPTPPPVKPCVIDIGASVCREFQKAATGSWEPTGVELPIASLDNYFAFTPQDILAVKKYSQDLAAWITKNAK